jgi:uncharacterized protein YnzC (UPF0291/DUF896 family)
MTYHSSPDKMDYLNSMRESIEKQISSIEESRQLVASINKKYKQTFLLQEVPGDYNELHNQFKEFHSKQFFEGRLIDLKNLLEQINIAINSSCDHICVVDYVDITEDRIQKITYCEKCWTTLPLLEKVEQKI